VFPHDGDSYETLLATADGRMYRDKTRRKRQPLDRPPDAVVDIDDIDIERAAGGVI
jgi:hypothetical protein